MPQGWTLSTPLHQQKWQHMNALPAPHETGLATHSLVKGGIGGLVKFQV